MLLKASDTSLTELTAKPTAVSAPHAHGPRLGRAHLAASIAGPAFASPAPHGRAGAWSPGPAASASHPSRYIWPGRYRAGATQPREPGAPSHPHSPRRVGPVAATPVKRDPHTCCTAPRLRSVLCGRQLCAPRCGRSGPVLRRLSLNSRI